MRSFLRIASTAALLVASLAPAYAQSGAVQQRWGADAMRPYKFQRSGQMPKNRIPKTLAPLQDNTGTTSAPGAMKIPQYGDPGPPIARVPQT